MVEPIDRFLRRGDQGQGLTSRQELALRAETPRAAVIGSLPQRSQFYDKVAYLFQIWMQRTSGPGRKHIFGSRMAQMTVKQSLLVTARPEAEPIAADLA